VTYITDGERALVRLTQALRWSTREELDE
jgi:hypothetical protein